MLKKHCFVLVHYLLFEANITFYQLIANKYHSKNNQIPFKILYITYGMSTMTINIPERCKVEIEKALGIGVVLIGKTRL